MQDIEARSSQAQSLWTQGDTALAANDQKEAYRLYTEAHDLIMDCAKLHEHAHRKLQTVTCFHANRREFYTDTVLLMLAPFGIFHLVAILLKSTVRTSRLCRGGT